MAWDPVWEEVFKEHAWGKYPAEDLIRFVALNFYAARNRQEVRLLEVGCGPGPNLWYMAREGFTVYGIDGSETAIQRARQRLDSECPGWKGELIVGDIKKLPYEDGFFDGVIDHEAVAHNSYEDSKIIYGELARVSKKNGKLFSRSFAKGCWGDGVGRKAGHNAWVESTGPFLNRGLVRFTDEKEIQDLIRGFKIASAELLTRTMENRQHEIKEWLIIGEKLG